MDQNDEETDDLITLGGCGQITYWRFPLNATLCPYFRCKSTFKYRSNAIAHYKKIHAPDQILCTICEKPIVATYITYFYKHYREKHPGVDIPENMNISVEEDRQPTQVRITNMMKK